MCEDRGIESYSQLQGIIPGTDVYARLCQLFTKADAKYNSGLFHFQPEKGREPPDELTRNLVVDDTPLKWILGSLYYPQSPYEFSVLPTEILGNVYEQFLGKVIRLTSGHRAAVEDKPEVKKAGGVYYTPSYIVDYIVKNTVGKLCDGKTPRQIANLRILDPACGSGSFLLGAYQYLLDYHRDWYLANNPQKHSKKIYQGRAAQWFLTIAEKKRILLSNIFGVDIDFQAVEVTKLSLLLKVLEGESAETIGQVYTMFHERALPDLAENIKCGNSLIAPDFFDDASICHSREGGNPDELRKKINAFNWQTEFPEIFSRKNPGFDAVISNPPYVRQEGLTAFKEYFLRNYRTYTSMADLYVPFIERGMSLLSNDARLSYIVANKWMRAKYGTLLREWLANQSIEEIVDFGDLPVFQRATTYPCIIRIAKQSPSDAFQAANIDTLEFANLSEYIEQNRLLVRYADLSPDGWTLVSRTEHQLLDKIKTNGVPLAQYVEGRVYYGVKTGLMKAFVITADTRNSLLTNNSQSAELIKPFLVGKDIKRYTCPHSDSFLILIPKGWTNQRYPNEPNKWTAFSSEYPAIARHLEPFAGDAQNRYDKGDYWWELRACDYYSEFEKPKIIYAEIASRGQFLYDSSSFYSETTAYIIPVPSLFLLGILNSKVFTYAFSSVTSSVRGGFYRWKRQYMLKMRIPHITPDDPISKAIHDNMVSLVQRMLDLNKKLAAAKAPPEKTRIQRDIKNTDNQIDQLVYKLYNLTPEEIKIIEDSAN